MRVATYNLRTIRAPDWNSFWYRRRRKLAAVVAALDVDVLGGQEAFPSQIRWLADHALPPTDWDVAALGRDRAGRGEAVPVWGRRSAVTLGAHVTRWYGDTPEVPGSKIPGSGFPRIVTIVDVTLIGGATVVVANTHLDHRSQDRRTRSLGQLATWLDEWADGRPVVVLGDFNCSSEAAGPLLDAGLRPALSPDDGPTAHDYGKGPATQIDHVFVSDHWTVGEVRIVRDAGHASDHWPVVVDLALH